MSEPTNTIQKTRKQKEDDVKRIRQDVSDAKKSIDGNPSVVDVLNALEARIELLEEEVL